MQANQLEQTNRLLSALLRLEKRVRNAESAEAVRFMAVNETLALVTFEQAAIGSARQGIEHLSGLSTPDLNAPYVNWLKRLVKYLGKVEEAQYLVASDLPSVLQIEWQEWLPAHLAALPLNGEWLLLARKQPFGEADRALLTEWSAILACHLNQKKHKSFELPSGIAILRSPLLWVALGLSATFITPVKMSVLAPAEVVAKAPAIVRAPLDAVVAEVLVSPDQGVNAGDLLFRFDDRGLRSQLNIAQQRIETAEVAYRQSAQRALIDAEAKSRLVLLQADIEEAQLEVAHLREQLSRTEVRAPISGQVLMPSQQEWLGRPVSLGERMVRLADPASVELRAWLSPSDQVPLKPGARLTLFDNAQPDAALLGELVSVGYQVEERPNGSYAFPVRGVLVETASQPSIGTRGTLRIEGDDVSLAYLIMRRPLAWIRQWLGV